MKLKVFLSRFFLVLILSYADARNFQTPPPSRVNKILTALKPYESFTSLFPRNKVASYILTIRNASVLIPNTFAVQVFKGTLQKAGKNINQIRYNLLKFLTIPMKQTRADFVKSLTNSKMLPYPTLFGAPIYAEVVLGGVYFFGDPDFPPGNAYMLQPDFYSDKNVSIHGIDNVPIPPNDQLFTSITKFPPPFRSSACDNVQPGYRLERNVRYSYNNLAFLNFSIVPNIEKCARNCTEMPRCVGFSVFNKICYLKHKLGMKIKSDSSDTYVKCGFKKLLNSPPKQYPPKDPSPPMRRGPWVTLPWYLGANLNETSITILVGTTVLWIWGDDKPHSIQDAEKDRNLYEGQGGGSKLITSPFTYEYTFSKPGKFFYFDSANPTKLQGTISVLPIVSLNTVPQAHLYPPPRAKCGADFHGYLKETNTDQNVASFLIIGSTKLSTCITQCSKRPTCHSFTWFRKSCYFKSRIGSKMKIVGAISYSKCR